MRRFSPFHLFFLVVSLILTAFVVWPEIDLFASGLFAHGQEGFSLRDNVFLSRLVKIVFYGARGIAVALLLGTLYLFIRGQKGGSKRWLFLLLCLLVGPGLLANVVFKDNWGRARPREIVAFGGSKEFTPAFYISNQCDRNCSFVSGDASFGFFLPAFAYVVAPRRRRKVFWGMVAVGSIFAGARLLLGAHFLSDVVAAGVLVTGVSAGLHALLFGRAQTVSFWHKITQRGESQ